MSDLLNVKVGDLLAVPLRFHRRGVRLVRVERVTRTQIVTKDHRYRRDSGASIGSDAFFTHFARVPTDQDMADAAYISALMTLARWRWEDLPDEAVLACAEIVKQHTKQDGGR